MSGMLVLARGAGRSLWIGRDVTVSVLKIDREGVTLGIVVPVGSAVTGDGKCERAGEDRYRVQAVQGDEIVIEGVGRIVINSIASDRVVRLAIDAPKRFAITRDDFSPETHIRHQERREREMERRAS